MSPGGKSAASSFRKLMGIGVSMFRRGFNSSRCKTEAKLATARIKLLRNRREVQVRQMRRDVAMLLESGQEATARIRVEHVIREQNTMAANEIIELFCELVAVRLSIIAKQRACPPDIKEGISSLIYAAPRCSEIPELSRLRDIFEKKYGRDFVSAATDLRPDSGVNRMLIEKLSVRTPSGEAKLKIMKEIAKEYQISWDTAESELELLKPSEDVLEGPRSFVSAASMPVKTTTPPQDAYPSGPEYRSSKDGMHFKDTVSAAQAAADLAEQAIIAAQAAAYLARQNQYRVDQTTTIDSVVNGSTKSPSIKADMTFRNVSCEHSSIKSKISKRIDDSQNFLSDEEIGTSSLDRNEIRRSCSNNVRAVRSDIKFDDSDGFDSDGDEEVEIETHSGHPPPNRRPPQLPPSQVCQPEERKVERSSFGSCGGDSFSRVHPKLPNYDELSARFEALKLRRS